MSLTTENIGKANRHFLKSDFSVTSWDDLKPYYENLISRTINSKEDLIEWLQDRSELESALQENLAWRYIRMSCDNTNEKLQQDYNYYVREIDPNISPEDNKLNEKFIACPFSELLSETDYRNYLRNVKQRISLFRKENIPLLAELAEKQQIFGQISGAQTITYNNQELTLQQASVWLKNTDRNIRETVYKKITARRLEDKKQLDDLYTNLIQLRHQVALNAGFKNFRDYSFAALERFDYSVEDCYRFHESIESEIKPVINQIEEYRKVKLGVARLMPWDLAVDPTGKPPIKPFNSTQEMVEKTISCLKEIDSEFANCITLLDDMNRFDLDSRKGKSPGGYNYPLYETGVPFIFMNSTGQLRDLVTMVHESGHAVHAVLAHNLPFHEMRSCPSEVAELASMSMELLTMEHWHHFISDEKELKRAKLEHLTSLIDILPWIAIVDAFQQWVYMHPEHSVIEREQEFVNLYNRFSGSVVDWQGNEKVKENLWQKQIHIFDSPFYYIEYGMAQLGAIALWKNYKTDATTTISNYKKALSLGYTKSIGEIYAAAGVRFDFSATYIKELSQFVQSEIDALQK